MDVVWNGALDKQRQEEARRGVKPKHRCTFSLIGDSGNQGSSVPDLVRHVDRVQKKLESYYPKAAGS